MTRIAIKDIESSAEPSEWPVLKPNGSKQGSLKLPITVYNIGKMSPAKAFSTWIQENLDQLFENMNIHLNDIKQTDLNVKYFVEIRKDSSSPNVSTRIEYQGEVEQDQCLVAPLKDFLVDEISLTSKSNKTGQLAFLTRPQKLSEVRVDLSLTSETENDMVHIPVASIPWDGHFHSIRQNKTQWQLRIYGEIQNGCNFFGPL